VESPSDPLLSYLGIISTIIIVTTNLPVIWMVKKEKKPSFINQLVCLDCFLSLCNIPLIFWVISDEPLLSYSLCGIRRTYTQYTSMLNRLIPVVIVCYRYIYVCRSYWVNTVYQRKRFNMFLCYIFGGYTVFLSIGCFIYREQNILYMKCMGVAGNFTSNQTVNDVWLLPLYHPIRLLAWITFFSPLFLVPIGYSLIYAFRQTQDGHVKGLNQMSRIARKNRNIVTVKFNFLIWLTETSSFLVLIPNRKMFYIFYFLFSSGLTPILCFIGIGENRKAVKEHIHRLIKESKRGTFF
jgi:hypothetical protein